jgi:hypothetical protein
MDEKKCIICGDGYEKNYMHTLDCGHKFHYNCLLKCFLCNKNEKMCPYCRKPQIKLPVVNGLKKYHKGIHYINNIDEINFENIKCQYILKSGKNSGNKCNNNCKVGFNYCGKHINK